MKVRDVIKRIEADSWYFKPADDVPVRTLGQIFKEAGLKKNA